MEGWDTDMTAPGHCNTNCTDRYLCCHLGHISDRYQLNNLEDSSFDTAAVGIGAHFCSHWDVRLSRYVAAVLGSSLKN